MSTQKICALIRQTWYETAKRNLKDSERLRFYETCFEYEFFDREPDPESPFASRLMFDMIRAEIDQDKERAQARADRNRENGSKGGRPKTTKVNNTDDNPVGFLGNFGLAYNNIHKQNKTRDNILDDKTEDTHTFFSICLSFFRRGSSDPIGEGHKFWGYYAGLGWQTKNGTPIRDRVALADAWQLADVSKSLQLKRAGYADLMALANPTEEVLLEEFLGLKRDMARKLVSLYFVTSKPGMLLDNYYLHALRQWIPKDKDGKPYNLEYQVKSDNEHVDE